HRDVKPGNILIRRDGRAVLSDFGLVHDGDHDTLTLSGEFLGTPAYAAPEQLRGDHAAIGPWTDIHGLGVSMYQRIAGRLPFQGANVNEFLRRIELGECPRLRKFAPKLPRDLETIVMTAMHADPAHRYRSASALVEDLERLSTGHPILARAASSWSRCARWVSRRRGSVLSALVGGGLALLLAVPVVGGLLQRMRTPALVAAHLRSARLALLDPAIGEHMFAGVHLHLDSSNIALSGAIVTRALAEYDAALQLDPDRVDIRAERQTVDLARGLVGKDCSEGVLQALAGTDRRRLGLLAFLLGAADLCTRAWEEFDLLIDSPDPLVDAALGELFLARDIGTRAFPRLLNASEAFPEAGFLLVDLADAALRSQESPVIARHYLDKAKAVGGRDTFETHVLVEADLCAAAGEVQHARELYEYMFPRHVSPTIRLHYARFLDRQGDRERAVCVLGGLMHGYATVSMHEAEFTALTVAWWDGMDPPSQVAVLVRAMGEPEVPAYGVAGFKTVLIEASSRVHRESPRSQPPLSSSQLQRVPLHGLCITLELLALDPAVLRACPPLLQRLAAGVALGLDAVLAACRGRN
ncbi:MAG TPA: serine/threonine-protein kinase, partial [Planctomycetota bacterium]|nr:serine/threonine-protein kinase [Planctomycetota bacterium]